MINQIVKLILTNDLEKLKADNLKLKNERLALENKLIEITLNNKLISINNNNNEYLNEIERLKKENAELTDKLFNNNAHPKQKIKTKQTKLF